MWWGRDVGGPVLKVHLSSALSPPHSDHDALFWPLPGWQSPSGKTPHPYFPLGSWSSGQPLRPWPCLPSFSYRKVAGTCSRSCR